ncbi:arsenite methyltransferase [Nocardioides sp. CPCC 205120]|uniref:arsenite methyltransferase n=1 Tax=Nocardioides sp. CPCC 205120 TaxID=3406462 RepID=UPI003B512BCF
MTEELRETVRARYAEAVAAEELRETVRARYAEAARSSQAAGCCGPDPVLLSETGLYRGNERDGATVFGAGLYDGSEQADQATATALEASLGCGVPTAVADLAEGEVVLDLGSGAGGDVLISARRVGASGKAYGLDMTPEMLELARSNAAAAGVDNVEFLEGYLEDVPLPDSSVDVVISNCVINLAADKRVVLAEAARVTRAGGRFAVSDVIADEGMDEATRADMAAFTGCIAGALTEAEYRDTLTATGWEQVTIETTHRVHDQAAAAVVRATRTRSETA